MSRKRPSDVIFIMTVLAAVLAAVATVVSVIGDADLVLTAALAALTAMLAAILFLFGRILRPKDGARSAKADAFLMPADPEREDDDETPRGKMPGNQ